MNRVEKVKRIVSLLSLSKWAASQSFPGFDKEAGLS